MDFFKYSGGL